MDQELEETEEENNAPETLETEHEQPEPEAVPAPEPEQSEHSNAGSNNEFEFYFQFTKPLVLYLPSPDERAIAAAWVQKLEAQPRSNEEKQLRLNYLKLLLFVLQRGHLTGIFRKQPSLGPLQPFPQGFTMMDMGNLMIDQSEAPGTGGGDAQAMPYSIEISNDLREFVAAQEIPNFGVQMYYAWSADEPVYKWNLFNEDNFPKYIINKINLLKEVKSEEKFDSGTLTKYCKKKPCDLPLLERGPKSKVKSPEEIEKSQARSYQTYVGLVGRMGNAYKGICDDDQDKYNKPEQRKCRSQRMKRGMAMAALESPNDNAELEGLEGINPYYHQQAQPEQEQGQIVCRCPPNYHLPNCEVRTNQMDRWQSAVTPPNPSGLATDTYVRGERSEQMEDCFEMAAPDSPFIPRMRPPSRGNERPFFRGPLTKKSEPPSRKTKSQFVKEEDLAKRKNEAVASKKGGPPRKPGGGKCYCTNQQCSCPCPRGPPPKGKPIVQPAGTAPQSNVPKASNVPNTIWCPQPTPSQPDPFVCVPETFPGGSLPSWARRGLEEQELLDPVSGSYTMPDMNYVYPSQEVKPSRRRWKRTPLDQGQPCLMREPSAGMPSVPSQQMPSKREERIVSRPGPSTAPMVLEENYPTTTKPTQKSLPGQSGAQQQGSLGTDTGGRLANMLSEIKQKTEAHKIKCKPISARAPTEADGNVERVLPTPMQTPPQGPPQYEPISQCPNQTPGQIQVPVHQTVPTPAKYMGAIYSKAPKRRDYYDIMERQRQRERVAKDLFGAKEAFSKRTLEGEEEGEYISAESMGECIAESSSSFECIDDQIGGPYVKRTPIQNFVPESPEEDSTLTPGLQNQNQGRVPKFYTSTPKQNFVPPNIADISAIPHCGPTSPLSYDSPTIRPVTTSRRLQHPIDFQFYEPMPPLPGSSYFGTPDPRQPAEFFPIDTYQGTPQNYQRSNDYEHTSYYAPPAVCVPESESVTFEPTLTPKTPLPQAAPTSMVPEMRRRSPERRNRSSSREREERRDDNWVEAPSRGTSRRRRDDTWATMQGETMSEREWVARRDEINDWATMHGELVCENESEGERKKRNDNLLPMQKVPAPSEVERTREVSSGRVDDWATMHGETICENEWIGGRRREDVSSMPLQCAPASSEAERESQAVSKVDDWATMHGVTVCETERDRERQRREVSSEPLQCAPVLSEAERARKAVIREMVSRVDDWETMHGELMPESESLQRARGTSRDSPRREAARRFDDRPLNVPLAGRENDWVHLNAYNSCRRWEEEGRRDEKWVPKQGVPTRKERKW